MFALLLKQAFFYKLAAQDMLFKVCHISIF